MDASSDRRGVMDVARSFEGGEDGWLELPLVGAAGQGDEDRAIGIAGTVIGRQTQRHAGLA